MGGIAQEEETSWSWAGPSSSQVGSSRWSFSWSVVEVAALVVVEVGVHYFFGRVGGCVRWN